MPVTAKSDKRTMNITLKAVPVVTRCSVLIYIQRIRGFTTMRYINLRFTYLLTYLHVTLVYSSLI